MKWIKYFSNYNKTMESYHTKKSVVTSFPRVIFIETTNACPMTCVMCPRQFMKRKVGFIKPELFKKILDEAGEYSSQIGFHFMGDPALHPQLKELIMYAHSKNVQASISLNPTVLDEKLSKVFIDAKLDDLIISLDGFDDESYKKIRGAKADYALALKNISKFLELKNGHKKPFVNIRMLYLPSQKDRFKEFFDKWSNVKGIDMVCLGPFQTWGNAIDIGATPTKTYRGVCFKPWHGMHITWDGKVVMCCYDFDVKYPLGDVNTQTLKEIWNSPQYITLREQNINLGKGQPICETCTEKWKPTSTRTHIIEVIYQRTRHIPFVRYLRKKVLGKSQSAAGEIQG